MLVYSTHFYKTDSRTTPMHFSSRTPRKAIAIYPFRAGQLSTRRSFVPHLTFSKPSQPFTVADYINAKYGRARLVKLQNTNLVPGSMACAGSDQTAGSRWLGDHTWYDD